MKTVSKKLLSLMLVAIMLFAAIPFHAFATEATKLYRVDVMEGTKELERKSADLSGITLPKTEDEPLTIDVAQAILQKADLAKYELVPEGTTTAGKYQFIAGESGVDDGVVISVKKNADSSETPPAPAEEAKEHSVTVRNDKDEVVENFKVSMKDSEFKNIDVYSAESARSLLNAGNSKFKDSFSNDKFVSMMKSSDGSVVIVLKNVSGGNSSNATKMKITVDTGSGTYTIEVYEGQKYKDFLANPARPGQKFLGWKSSVDGTISDTTVVSADANGSTVTALWAEATKYTITFVDERGTSQDVYRGKQVAYGSALGELPTPSSRKGYVFKGWKINGKFVNAETVYEWQDDVTAYAEWALESDTSGKPMDGTTNSKTGKVYLEIYINDNTKTVEKRIDITSYASDDKITRAEVETVVKKYVTAKSGYSLKLIGLFDEEGWYNYTHDPETDGEKEIVVNRDGDDYIYVVVNNVKTVTKDTTNPKTGDTAALGAAAVILVLSAGALTTTTLLKKKVF